ncbi:lipopolysaccharide biosynthesis protein [Bacteroides sp. AN502(2024)]|uniref:lipopolysaccharide biosynthesis protein n=1 Tax=Bacteroides sp. AN502(2024) TaxID=3160599 RepID=UPI0035193A63
MGRNSLLLKNTFIISIGKVCTQLITYLLLPIYTTILTPSDYGTIDLLLTYILLISPVITIQMEMSIFRFLIDTRGNKQETARVLSNCLACAMGPSLLFIILYFPIALSLDFEYLGPFLSGIITNSILCIALQIARGLGDNMSYAVGSAISGIMTVLLNIIFVIIFPYGVAGMLYSTAIAQFIAFCYIIIRDEVCEYIDFSLLCRNLMKKMARYSVPLILNGLSWWIISASDRTLASVVLGTHANGILAVVIKFSAIVTNVFAIFNLSWTESVAVHINDKDRDIYISDITQKCFNLFSTGGIVLIMICAVFFKYLVNEKFYEAYPLIPLFVIGNIINIIQTLYGIIYIGKKDTKQVSRTAFIAAIVNFITNVIFIKYIGLYAAAISTISAMLFLAIYRHKDINRNMNITLDAKDIWIMCGIYAIFVFIYLIRNPICNIIGLVTSICFAMLWNKAIITSVLFYIKDKFPARIRKRPSTDSQ